MINNKHEACLHDWIKTQGAIRSDEFMSWVLYDPIYGYYNQAPGMAGKDFITAPEMGDLFIDALSSLMADWSISCENLVELGPGTGRLIQQLIRRHTGVFKKSYCVEISQSLKSLQASQGKPDKAITHINLDEIPSNSLIIANECLDALPSRRFKRQDGILYEGYVNWVDDSIDWLWKKVDIKLDHCPLVDGLFDVRDYSEILAAIKSAMPGSICIWFDYGYHAKELSHLPHLGDSLRGFFENRVESNVFKHVGKMDITADVNFSTLAHQIADQGWLISQYFKQSHWIMNYLAACRNNDYNTWEIRQLTDPTEMGERVRCLVFTDPALSLQRLMYDECARL